VAELARLRRDLRIVDLSNKRIAAFLGLTTRRVQQYQRGVQPTRETPASEASKVIGHSSETSPATALQTGGSETAAP